MNRKGHSPVIEIILLLALAVVAVVVVYIQFNQLTQLPAIQETGDPVPPQEMDYPYYTATHNGSNGTHVLTRHCKHFSSDNKTCRYSLNPTPELPEKGWAELEYGGELP